jgi:hypothetical protein
VAAKNANDFIADTFTMFANSDNVTVVDDLLRRTSRCALDPNTGAPSAEPFAATRRLPSAATGVRIWEDL